MCYQIVERYFGCKCKYHVYAVDPCGAAGRVGHQVSIKTVFVGYVCPRHGTRQDSKDTTTRSSTDSVSSGQPYTTQPTVATSISSNDLKSADREPVVQPKGEKTFPSRPPDLLQVSSHSNTKDSETKEALHSHHGSPQSSPLLREQITMLHEVQTESLTIPLTERTKNRLQTHQQNDVLVHGSDKWSTSGELIRTAKFMTNLIDRVSRPLPALLITGIVNVILAMCSSKHTLAANILLFGLQILFRGFSWIVYCWVVFSSDNIGTSFGPARTFSLKIHPTGFPPIPGFMHVIVARIAWHCNCIGNGLIAAGLRSTGYALKSKWRQIGSETSCRCGQRHSIMHGPGVFDLSWLTRRRLSMKLMRCWRQGSPFMRSTPTLASPQTDANESISSTASSHHSQSTPTDPTTEASSSAATSSAGQTAKSQSEQSHQDNPTPIVGTEATQTNAISDLRYLLLCVNISKHGIILKNVDVHSARNDLDLMNAIRNQYNAARGRGPWHYLRSFDQPVSVDLIKFRLIPRRYDTRVGVLCVPSIPPVDEVKVRNRYHYCACIEPNEVPYLPMDTAFLDAFFDPVEHTTRFWINHLPKKLKQPLHYDPDSDTVVGWGIRIIEGPNLLLFSIVISTVIFVLTILCTIWVTVFKAAVSDAFTVASYAVALAVWVTSLYFYWQQMGSTKPT